MVFNATFNILAGSFIGEGNRGKTTDLPQVTDKLSYNVVSSKQDSNSQL